MSEQLTASINGSPPFTFISSTIFLVPTNTEVPVSITPEDNVHDDPLMDTLLTSRTHQAYILTG